MVRIEWEDKVREGSSSTKKSGSTRARRQLATVGNAKLLSMCISNTIHLTSRCRHPNEHVLFSGKGPENQCLGYDVPLVSFVHISVRADSMKSIAAYILVVDRNTQRKSPIDTRIFALKNRLNRTPVPTGERSAELCTQLGFQTTNLDACGASMHERMAARQQGKSNVHLEPGNLVCCSETFRIMKDAKCSNGSTPSEDVVVQDNLVVLEFIGSLHFVEHTQARVVVRISNSLISSMYLAMVIMLLLALQWPRMESHQKRRSLCKQKFALCHQTLPSE